MKLIDYYGSLYPIVQVETLRSLVSANKTRIWHEGVELGLWYCMPDGDVCFVPENPFDRVIEELGQIKKSRPELADIVGNIATMVPDTGSMYQPKENLLQAPSQASVFVNHAGMIKPVILVYRNGSGIILETP